MNAKTSWPKLFRSRFFQVLMTPRIRKSPPRKVVVLFYERRVLIFSILKNFTDYFFGQRSLEQNKIPHP